MSLDDFIARIDATIDTWRDTQQRISTVRGDVDSTTQQFAALGNEGIPHILNGAAGNCDEAKRQIEATIHGLNEARSLVVQAKNYQDGNGGAGSAPVAPAPAPTLTSSESGYPHHKEHPMSWSDLHHIAYGDPDNPRKGGHMSGMNRPGKTEFPSEWDDEDISTALTNVATRPDETQEARPGVWFATGVHNGVTVRAVVDEDGRVNAGWPVSGPGVQKNPPARKR